MKKIILTITIGILFAYEIYAQESSAKAAFAAGDYATSVKLYETAIAVSGNTTSLSVGMRNARACTDFLNKANKAYVNKQYENARQYYQSILKLNPADRWASQRVSACTKVLSAEFDKRNQQNEYFSLIKTCDADKMAAYVKKYPDSEECKLFEFILKGPAQYPKKSDEFRYMLAGDMFFKVGKKTQARLWYDNAASLANAEALYKKALTYDDFSIHEAKSLLVLSYVGGFEPALTKINEIKVGQRYDKYVANQLYKCLCNYRNDIQSFVYVYVNKEYYNIDKLNLEHYAKNILNDVSEWRRQDDNLIYQFATILESMNLDADNVIRYAASKGNSKAIDYVLNQQFSCLLNDNPEEVEAYFEPHPYGYGNYLKYLKGESLLNYEWRSMPTFVDRHVHLMSNIYTITSKSDLKSLKSFLDKFPSERWDSAVISEIKRNVNICPPKYVTKILTLISELNTEDGIFDKNTTPTSILIKSGLYNVRHKSRPFIHKSIFFFNN